MKQPELPLVNPPYSPGVPVTYRRGELVLYFVRWSRRYPPQAVVSEQPGGPDYATILQTDLRIATQTEIVYAARLASWRAGQIDDLPINPNPNRYT